MDTLSGSSTQPEVEETENFEAEMDSIESAIAENRPDKVWDTLAQIRDGKS